MIDFDLSNGIQCNFLVSYLQNFHFTFRRRVHVKTRFSKIGVKLPLADTLAVSYKNNDVSLKKYKYILKIFFKTSSNQKLLIR